MSLESLLEELGYRKSPFFRESPENPDPAIAHVLRDAKRAHVRGSYFVRTTEGVTRERPAVHVAEASTPEKAREIHQRLWNQGSTPFLIVSLPAQVRVYTLFDFDGTDELVGQITKTDDLEEVAEKLAFLHASSIDSGEIWKKVGQDVSRERRVDRALLGALRELSEHLIDQHRLSATVAHSLVGRFVYLYYLRHRGILSDYWLSAAGVTPDLVFSRHVHVESFRRLTHAVDERFNGHIFPIDWTAPDAPDANAVRAAGRAFAGESLGTGQLPLFNVFDFSFIPIELLSAIYEQFLHDVGGAADHGAFYTPETVADYLLTDLNSVVALRPGMKVLDPCCGSGVFLVLAFRQLVEQELRGTGRDKLLPKDLRRILTMSIFGVERDRDACLVTEFSLILALLSYIDPPELHRLPTFKFPTLHGTNIFEADFFSDDSAFWSSDIRFDWIVGNPPWLELDRRKPIDRLAISWIERVQAKWPVARFRSSEAFSWRVREKLAENGVIGLITPATTLSNDQSAEYRRAFFQQNHVHRITNFSNLAYILFESAEEPAATIIYSAPLHEKPDVLHFGPLAANQMATTRGSGRRIVPWSLTITDSEVQLIPAAEAERGEAATWKRALWGNPRDHRALKRLRAILPNTLGALAKEKGWTLALGLQLRPDSGRRGDPNKDIARIRMESGASPLEAEEAARWFAGLRVLDRPRRQSDGPVFEVPDEWLVRNKWGTYVRARGGSKGLPLARAPHLFLGNTFAAYSDKDFIFRHPDVGISAPSEDADWLRAISVIWSSSITPYMLVLGLSASWGISRSVIDLGDAETMSMPRFTNELVRQLSSVHREYGSKFPYLADDDRARRKVDEAVMSVLGIPRQVMTLAQEFMHFRMPLLKGKMPRTLMSAPDAPQLQRYADMLKAELDGFIEGRNRRHDVTVLKARAGIVATVELKGAGVTSASVLDGDHAVGDLVHKILQSAQREHGQWAYVRRSVRVFGGRKVYICKPARRLEWTETQALLDAADLVAEITHARGMQA